MKKQILAITLIVCANYGQGRACQSTLVRKQPVENYKSCREMLYPLMPLTCTTLQAEKALCENMPILLNCLGQTTDYTKIITSIRESVDKFEGTQEDQFLTALMVTHIDLRELITQLMGGLSNLAMSLEANRNRLALTKNSPEAVQRALAELSFEPFEKMLLQAQGSFKTNAAEYFVRHPESISARLGASDEFIQGLVKLTKTLDFIDTRERNLRTMFAEFVASKTRLDALNNLVYHTDVILHGAGARQRAESRKSAYDAIVNPVEAEFGNTKYFKMAQLFSFDAQTPEAQAFLPGFYEACANSSINIHSQVSGNAVASTLQTFIEEQKQCQRNLDECRVSLQTYAPNMMQKLEHARLAVSGIESGASDLAHKAIVFQRSIHSFSQASPLEAFTAIVEAVKEIITSARNSLEPGNFEGCVTYRANYMYYALIAERAQLLFNGLHAQWQAAVTR